MTYSLYSGIDLIGHVGTVFSYARMISEVRRYNRARGGGGKVPFLTELLSTGHTDNPRKAAKDIPNVLEWGEHFDRDTVGSFKNLKSLLMKSSGEAVIGES